MKNCNIFILSGPSGSGKSTLIESLLSTFNTILRFSISTTTRPKRKGEIDGVHYYFETKEKFEEMIRNGELVEYQKIYDNYYGTTKKSIQSILDNNLSVIMDIDVYGKVNFDKVYPDSVGILVLPPSIDDLKERLILRAREPIEEIEKRLEIAKKEIDFAKSKGNYKYTVVNDDLEESKKILEDIIKKELHI